jgi:hypothetical protein
MKYIERSNIDYLKNVLLDNNNQVKMLSINEYAKIPHMHIMQWSSENARYQFPTTELISWLKNKINNRSAIEVAAGMGDISYHLGIPASDNRSQERPEMRLYYSSLGVAITSPPERIETLDAVEAVKKYNPQVVIASWLTQKYLPGDEEKKIGSNVYGPDEFEIITHPSVECYIHIGNYNTHKDKRILQVQHQELQFNWLKSRAMDQSKNVLFVWGN